MVDSALSSEHGIFKDLQIILHECCHTSRIVGCWQVLTVCLSKPKPVNSVLSSILSYSEGKMGLNVESAHLCPRCVGGNERWNWVTLPHLRKWRGMNEFFFETHLHTSHLHTSLGSLTSSHLHSLLIHSSLISYYMGTTSILPALILLPLKHIVILAAFGCLAQISALPWPTFIQPKPQLKCVTVVHNTKSPILSIVQDWYINY